MRQAKCHIEGMAIDKDRLYGFIGKKIHTRRRYLDITQSELGSAINVTKASISAIEAGTQATPLYRLYEICDVLKIDLLDILPNVS